MLEKLLVASTILGGIAAVFYFIEQFRNGATSPSQRGGRKKRSRQASRNLLPLPIVTKIQWILSVFFLSEFSMFSGMLALLASLWVLAVSYAVVRYVTRRAGLSCVLSGLTVGLISAGVANLLHNSMTLHFLGFGLYFGAIAACWFSEPSSEITIATAGITTALMLAGLGVFNNLDFFLDSSIYIVYGHSFVFAAAAAILVISIPMSVNVADDLFRRFEIWSINSRFRANSRAIMFVAQHIPPARHKADD